jgi:hypothetical protein
VSLDGVYLYVVYNKMINEIMRNIAKKKTKKQKNDVEKLK